MRARSLNARAGLVTLFLAAAFAFPKPVFAKESPFDDPAPPSPGFATLPPAPPAGIGNFAADASTEPTFENPPEEPETPAPPGGSLEDLRSRLDALERQNAELISRLDGTADAPTGEDPTESPMGVEAGSSGVGGDGEGAAAGSSDAGTGTRTTEASAVDEGDGWYEVGSDLEMTGSWNNGLEFTTENKDFRVHIGGRVQMDGVWFDESEAFTGAGGEGDDDAVFFRRARIRIDGTMYEWIDWAAEFDFVNSSNFNQGSEPASQGNVVNVPAPTDLWVNFKGVPIVGNVRVGHFKEPIGMEHLTSSRFLPFLERSFNQDAFYGPFNNGFSSGLMLWDTYAEQRGTWSTGVFKDLDNPFAYNVADGEYAWTSRVTYLPWYDEASEGRSLFHVGLSNSLRDPANEDQRYRARPSLRNGPGPFNPTLADTGLFEADTVDHLGAEAAMNYGSLTLQAEYTGGFVYDALATTGPAQGRNLGDEFVQGGYVQALYFLTGEHMHYERTSGVFGRVEPLGNAYVLKGLRGNIFTKGAWQVGVRYSRLDLDSSSALDGGVLDDWTFGLNWYLNPNMKVQSNYVVTDRDVPAARGEDGLIHGFGMRLAYDF